MKHNEKQNIFNTKEVAEIFGVGEYTIREWAKEGRVPAHKIGKQWFFWESALLDKQAIEDAKTLIDVEESHVNDFDLLLKDKSLNVRVELKSSILKESGKGKYWRFTNLHKQEKSDYYLLLGYNEKRTELLEAFFIPTNELAKYYEVRCQPSNKNKFGRSKGISIYENDEYMRGFSIKEN